MTLPCPPDGYQILVDTSVAQGAPTWVPWLAELGVAGVIARATEGEHDVDRWYAATAKACASARMLLGAYGVLEPYGRGRAAGQARHFVDVVRAAGVDVDLPPVLDWELGRGRAASDVIASARIWCETVEELLERQVMVYCGIGFVSGLAQLAGLAGEADLAALATRPLWVADYGSGHRMLLPGDDRPRIPRPWTRAALWQTGPEGATLPGGVAVDVSWWQGSREGLLTLGRGSPVVQAAGG